MFPIEYKWNAVPKTLTDELLHAFEEIECDCDDMDFDYDDINIYRYGGGKWVTYVRNKIDDEHWCFYVHPDLEMEWVFQENCPDHIFEEFDQ